MKIKKDILYDFENYREHLKQRKLLIDEMPNVYENYFSIIYIAINILLKVDKYKTISKNEKIFRTKIVENLVKSIDLINIKYMRDTDKLFRSLIEAFFKLMLESERIKIFNKNKSEGIYSATDEMITLKKVATQNKTGRLTSYTKEYFGKSFPQVEKLYEYYSELSGSVHVSDQYTEPLYLIKYNELEILDICENIHKYITILDIVLDKLILMLEELYNTKVISRENYIYLKQLLNKEYL
ncbi:hypothetical protein ACSSAF_06770 [Staphylococcus succinus]|uniref:hypothetical protein n=1 Tax=Staphylococcus succinus TaxID=61015 RepID=UPI003F5B5C80